MRLYHGIVEDVNDPMKSDRVRVRVYELHTDMKSMLPTKALPWAQVMNDSRDASMSGIGRSGSGLVCGSWVILYFLDADCQYPIVLGTLKGIPVEPAKTVAHDINDTIYSSTVANESILLDGSGNPVQTDSGAPVTVGVNPTSPLPVGARRATDFKSIGERGIILIQGSEGFRANAYQDQGGVWTIGYGTVFYPDGSRVQPGQTITKERAAEIFAETVNKRYLPWVHKTVTVPVTQEMVDALTSLAYNIESLKKSWNLITDLNAGNYELAASRFMEFNTAKIKGVSTVIPGLTARREREKNLFLSGGIPSDVSGVDEFPLPPEPPRTIPLVSVPEFPTESETNKQLAGRGFSDPNAKYPLYRDEPDTNRLARHEKIVETVVYKKEVSRDLDVVIAGTDGKKTWSQSPIPYNARYPNNEVIASKSGHLLEFDDTENCRRVHLYHASGTFTEVDENGTQVNRIVGDGYEIFERNGYVHVKGALHVNIDGVHSVKVSGACSIDVDGETTINVFNDVKLNVSGDMKTTVKGDHITHVTGKMSIRCDGDYMVDANRIDLNSDKADSLDPPKDKKTPEEIVFSELSVITRGTESTMQYETPEETGNRQAYEDTRTAKGEATPEEKVELKEEKKESVSAPVPETPPAPTSCDGFDAMESFPPSLQLSRHFTLGSFNKSGQRPLIQQMGLKPSQIACNLKGVATALDLVKDMFPHMIITSGFRRPGDAPNSSRTSKHYSGEAVDIQFPGYNRKEYLEAAKKIIGLLPAFDQVILEYQGASTTWIHIGIAKSAQRRQVFTMNNHARHGNMGELVLLA